MEMRMISNIILLGDGRVEPDHDDLASTEPQSQNRRPPSVKLEARPTLWHGQDRPIQ